MLRRRAGAHPADDLVRGRVDLHDLTRAVERGVDERSGRIDHQVTRAAAHTVDPRDAERREVDHRDLRGAHDRDVGRLRVGAHHDAARVRAERDALHFGVRRDVDHALVVGAPVRHEHVATVGRDGYVLGHRADLDRLVDGERGHRYAVHEAVRKSRRRRARVLAFGAEAGAVHRVVRHVRVGVIGRERSLDGRRARCRGARGCRAR